LQKNVEKRICFEIKELLRALVLTALDMPIVREVCIQWYFTISVLSSRYNTQQQSITAE
jgi:hypothetical protein